MPSSSSTRSLVGLALLLVALLVSLAAVRAPLTVTGALYVLATLVFTLGLALDRRGRRLSNRVAGLGVVLFAGVLAFRLITVGAEGPGARIERMPEGFEARSVGRALAEEDGVQLALALMAGHGFATEREREGFAEALDEAYADFRARHGTLPTPLIPTVLGMQEPNAFELIHVDGPHPDDAVLFLHGAAGNWSLLCWLVADAARDAGLSTYCPSVGVAGDWERPDSLEVVRTSLRRMRARGVTRVHLVALSQGAASLSGVVDAFPEEFASLLMLFGVDTHLTPPTLPSAIVHGIDDERFLTEVVEATAENWRALGADIELHAVDGDHFALVKRRVEVRRIMATWLQACSAR